MTVLELFGHWWVDGDVENVRSGRLVIEDDGSCRLELTGGVDLGVREVGQPYRDRVAPRVYGVAEDKAVTLLRCFMIHARGGFGEPVFQRLSVQRAVVGVHISGDGEQFRAALVRAENLTSWLRLPGLTRDGRIDDRRYEAVVEQADSLRAVIPGWEIEGRNLVQPFQRESSHERDLISSEIAAYLVLRPESPVALDAFDRIVAGMLDLLTLASGEPCGLISLTLIDETDNVQQDRDGSELRYERQADVYGRRIYSAQPAAPAPPDWRFRFSCEDTSFSELVPKWIDLRERAESACNVFFGLLYARPVYTETRVLLSAIAAESLHDALLTTPPDMAAADFARLREKLLAVLDSEDERRWVKRELRNRPTFKSRLNTLFAVPSAEATDLVVADRDKWMRDLVIVRNGLAHEGGATAEGLFELEWATTGIITLVLMSEIGLSATVQKRAAKDLLATRN